MAREIKFRAWNIITKQMIDLKKITPLALNIDTDGLFIPFSGMPLMQYTGLKDKNGIEIYEGDIVKIVFADNLIENGKIVWDFNNSRWSWMGKDGGDGYGFTFKNDFEVIGNIHANPELIAEVKV